MVGVHSGQVRCGEPHKHTGHKRGSQVTDIMGHGPLGRQPIPMTQSFPICLREVRGRPQARILWRWVEVWRPRPGRGSERRRGLGPCPQEGGGRCRLFWGHLSRGLVGQELTSVCASQPVSSSRVPPLQTISALKARVSELQWSVMNQEMQVKSLESERQELKEQLALQHK